MNRLLTILFGLLITAFVIASPALGTSQGRLYLLDDCSGRAKFFFEGEVGPRKFKYNNNMYQIDARTSRIYANSVHTEDLDNYTVVANLKLLETRTLNDASVMGISFDYIQDLEAKTHSFYSIVVRADHRLLLYRNINDEITELWQSAEIPNIDLSNGVILTASVKANEFKFNLNGKDIGSYTDKSGSNAKSGGVGLYAGPFTLIGVTQFKLYLVPPVAATYKEEFSEQPKPKTWFTGTASNINYTVENDVYNIDATKSDQIGLSLLWPVGTDYDVIVDTKFLAGDDSSGYGLVFRATDDGQGGIGYYRLLLTAQGAWALQIRRHGREDNIIDWQLSDYFKQNSINRLEVRCRGMRFSFFLNNKELTTLEYESYPSGTVGLIVGPGASVAFDDFWLKTGISTNIETNSTEKLEKVVVEPDNTQPKVEADDPLKPPENIPPEGL